MCMEILWSTICTILYCLEVPLWCKVVIHVTRGQLFIFLTTALRVSMYTEDVLLHYIVPYMPFVVDDSSSMPDNVHLHMAQSTLNFSEEMEIGWFEVVSKLQPRLEPHWTCLKYDRQTHLTSYSPSKFPQCVETILHEEWEAIPQEIIRALTVSLLEPVINCDSGLGRQYVLLASIFG